jgi:hypothetical protein
MSKSNVLYLTVLPLVYLSRISFNPYLPNALAQLPWLRSGYGEGKYGEGKYGGDTPVEQILTLFPEENFATRFFPDEVDKYVAAFSQQAEQFLKGGHVVGYAYIKMPTDDGRVVVKVVQSVE